MLFLWRQLNLCCNPEICKVKNVKNFMFALFTAKYYNFIYIIER